MDFDAFHDGIEPGGLRSKSDIRILLCYIFSSVDAPLSDQDIVTVLQENGFANYFEVMDALSSLQSNGIITLTQSESACYTANDKTKEIAKQLYTTLPLAIREKALAGALELLAAAKREKENQVDIEKAKNGYRITCHISGGDNDLMSFSLYVPDYAEAKFVKKNFLKNPERFYKLLLSTVTENYTMIQDTLKGILTR